MVSFLRNSEKRTDMREAKLVWSLMFLFRYETCFPRRDRHQPAKHYRSDRHYLARSWEACQECRSSRGKNSKLEFKAREKLNGETDISLENSRRVPTVVPRSSNWPHGFSKMLRRDSIRIVPLAIVIVVVWSWQKKLTVTQRLSHRIVPRLRALLLGSMCMYGSSGNSRFEEALRSVIRRCKTALALNGVLIVKRKEEQSQKRRKRTRNRIRSGV